MRRQREDEISELESLGPTRSNLQEDRLRKLRLEMEFQHRVDIVANQDDDEVEADEAEVLERAEQRERQLLRQEELERSRQRRLEWQQQQQQAQTEEQEQRLRRLKIEENKLKEELQVTQQVEDRLIREAKKRRDEPKIGMDPSNMTPDDGLSSQQQQKLERFLARAAAAPNNNNTISSSSTNIGSNYNNTSAINSNNILATSKPALRNGSDSNGPKKVSWNHAVNVVEQASDIQYADESDEAEPNAESNESDIEAMSMNSGSNGSHKRSETTTTIREEDEEEDEEEVEDSFTLQDIDEVLGAPVDTEFGPNGGQSNCTPNVIGAQEVYRDPRDRIKAEKQKQNHNSWTNQVPEKLSFHEKKKMFAMEADQMHEKEKLRMAKQPREIDTK